jgi:hypothetical protein
MIEELLQAEGNMLSRRPSNFIEMEGIRKAQQKNWSLKTTELN